MGAELERNPLWLILVETVHALPMFSHHKSYVRDRLIFDFPDISVEELSHRLDISLGEAMVILHEISEEKAERTGAEDEDGLEDYTT